MYRFHGRWEKVIAEAEENIQKETEGYPESAVHELLINAFCHRNFDSTQCNQIILFENRIEIFNPEFSQRAMMKKIFAAVVSVLYPQIL